MNLNFSENGAEKSVSQGSHGSHGSHGRAGHQHHSPAVTEKPEPAPPEALSRYLLETSGISGRHLSPLVALDPTAVLATLWLAESKGDDLRNPAGFVVAQLRDMVAGDAVPDPALHQLAQAWLTLPPRDQGKLWDLCGSGLLVWHTDLDWSEAQLALWRSLYLLGAVLVTEEDPGWDVVDDYCAYLASSAVGGVGLGVERDGAGVNTAVLSAPHPLTERWLDEADVAEPALATLHPTVALGAMWQWIDQWFDASIDATLAEFLTSIQRGIEHPEGRFVQLAEAWLTLSPAHRAQLWATEGDPETWLPPGWTPWQGTMWRQLAGAMSVGTAREAFASTVLGEAERGVAVEGHGVGDGLVGEVVDDGEGTVSSIASDIGIASEEQGCVVDRRRALSEQLLAEAGLDPRVRHRYRITEPEVILAMIWQGQAEREALDNAPEVLADKLRDYLMGQREPLVFYEAAVRQVADWLATGPEGWGELLGAVT